MGKVETTKELEFKWGKKKGIGGKNKDVQFYESFTYDGVDYDLYDCVYLYKDGEAEPEIGKLIKIWETGEKAKKVKVLWFFRPCEILNFLGAEEMLENELFLASGEGLGLANLNPLEAIAGKCNVLCISKDKENRQPSDDELQMAEFVFRRTFDVRQRKIMDNIDGKIAGIDVKFLFNRMDIQKPGGVLKVDLGKNEVCVNAIESNETKVISTKNSFRKQITLEKNRNFVDSSSKEIGDRVKQKTSLVEKPGVVLKPSDMDTINEKREDASELKALSRPKFKSSEGEVKCGKDLARQDEEIEKVKNNKDLIDLDNRPTKKAKLDNTMKLADDKEKSGVQGHVVEENLDHGQSKKGKLDTSIEMMNDKCESTDQRRNDVRVISPTASTLDNKRKLNHAKDSLGTRKDPCKKIKPDKATKPKDKASKTEDKASKPLEKASKPIDKASNPLDKPSKLEDEDLEPKDKSSKPQDKASKLEYKSLKPRDKSLKPEDMAAKPEDKVLKLKDKATEPKDEATKPKDKATTLSNGKLLKISERRLAGDSLGVDKDPSMKMKPRDRATPLPDAKLPKSPPPQPQHKAEKFDGQVLEVARRPNVDRRTWFKGIPWEDRMQTALEQGTLVLLQNLDPAYDSAEVEDIVWHGFKESCTAKMIQRTASSSPHYGQALVILKTREAAQMVVRKLDEGCLLLSSGRPLVGSIVAPCSWEKKTTFFGHLVIDKLRHQMMREMKEAVSTSHCSQPNTIEYDMAMEWCLQQQRSDILWNSMYKQHGKEIRKLKAELKAK